MPILIFAAIRHHMIILIGHTDVAAWDDCITVVELFGGMANGLECMLRNGFYERNYYYCDTMRCARVVVAHRLQAMSDQSPVHFPVTSWNAAFTIHAAPKCLQHL